MQDVPRRLADGPDAGRRGRRGLVFVLGGAWWFAVLSGWLSAERTWPLLVVGFGIWIGSRLGGAEVKLIHEVGHGPAKP